ncbi:MAG TPA: hypothetical protein VMS43_07240 [Allosphingosinicella sp.]|nr:hypothetical protein [Allosphingosinicella sp.]
MTIATPPNLRANAWTGAVSPAGELATSSWGQRGRALKDNTLLAPTPVDERDWMHPDIGWGLVLPDNEAITEAERATAADAPEPIRNLLAARPGSPVLRYRADLENGWLRRYYPDRPFQDMSVQASRPGVGEGRLPRYLLIAGSPTELPWSIQYQLNMSRYVGRLDLDEGGLANYVNALLADWAGPQPDASAPVLWNVDHGGNDITRLMAFAIGEKLWERLAVDADAANRKRLTGNDATAAKLADTLSQHKPAFVATTSHGMTGPLDDAQQLAARLGLLVDGDYAALDPATLLGGWAPSGAIWYAHACCSAGSDTASRYADLFPQGDSLATLLAGVSAGAGSRSAPLPRALLGAARPLRAFVGHVEPTFDWTLRDPDTGQILTHEIVSALYNQLFRRDFPTPIGYALGGLFREAGAFFAGWSEAVGAINDNVAGARATALYRKLVAMDRQGIVLLGDPTVCLSA